MLLCNSFCTEVCIKVCPTSWLMKPKNIPVNKIRHIFLFLACFACSSIMTTFYSRNFCIDHMLLLTCNGDES